MPAEAGISQGAGHRRWLNSLDTKAEASFPPHTAWWPYFPSSLLKEPEDLFWERLNGKAQPRRHQDSKGAGVGGRHRTKTKGASSESPQTLWNSLPPPPPRVLEHLQLEIEEKDRRLEDPTLGDPESLRGTSRDDDTWGSPAKNHLRTWLSYTDSYRSPISALVCRISRELSSISL